MRAARKIFVLRLAIAGAGVGALAGAAWLAVWVPRTVPPTRASR